MLAPKTKIYTYDIRTDEAFTSLSHSFAHALRAVEPMGSVAVPYHGTDLYHHFQIGVNGISGSGKSTFLTSATNEFLPVNEASYKSLLVSSADQTRKVLAWSQWLARNRPFEVRTEDTIAQFALAENHGNAFLPESQLPGISFFEHAPEDLHKFCPMLLRFEYLDGKRRFVISTTEEIANLEGFRDKFLAEASAFQIS